MSAKQGQEINLTTLQLPQLKMLHDQFDSEIEYLTSSMQSLKGAQTQFESSKRCLLKSMTPENEGKSVLVPLTSSLYVPANLVDTNKVLIDIGTNYYVEKNISEAEEFFKRKSDYVKQQMEKFQPILQHKFKTRQLIVEVMQTKLLAQSKQQSDQKK
ncbi:prefoldin subunit 5 [Ciona intestinalis]